MAITTPLIFLPGALGPLEGGEAAMADLRARRPVAVVDYRAQDRFETLVARILVVATGLGAERFDLLGQSYGGWIAQCVARLQPKRVRRMVLSHSFVLRPGDAWRFRLGASVLRRLPHGLARTLLLRRVAGALAPLRIKDAARHQRQLSALAERSRSPLFFETLAAQQDVMRESLAAAGEASISLPVLIIESDRDPMVPRGAQTGLRDRWPAAEVRRFHGAGHISAAVATEDYVAAIDAFLSR